MGSLPWKNNVIAWQVMEKPVNRNKLTKRTLIVLFGTRFPSFVNYSVLEQGDPNKKVRNTNTCIL